MEPPPLSADAPVQVTNESSPELETQEDPDTSANNNTTSESTTPVETDLTHAAPAGESEETDKSKINGKTSTSSEDELATAAVSVGRFSLLRGNSLKDIVRSRTVAGIGTFLWPRLGDKYQTLVGPFEAGLERPELEEEDPSTNLTYVVQDLEAPENKHLTFSWTRDEKDAFEKALYRHSADFDRVCKTLAEESPEGHRRKNVRQCVAFFWDEFYSSPAYKPWNEHDCAERELEIQRLQNLVRSKQRSNRRRTPTLRSSSNELNNYEFEEMSSEESLDSDNEEEVDDYYYRKKRRRKRRQRRRNNYSTTSDESEALAPWESPFCEFIPSHRRDLPNKNDSGSDSEADSKKWCVCQTSSEGNMVECAVCKTWFHAVCMGLRNDILDEDSVFRCAKCAIVGPRFGQSGPELEAPTSNWSLMSSRGEPARVLVVINQPMMGVIARQPESIADFASFTLTPQEALPVGSCVALRAPPRGRAYTLLLGNRKVPVWDSQHKVLVAGLKTPNVFHLVDFLRQYKACAPFRASFKRNPRFDQRIREREMQELQQMEAQKQYAYQQQLRMQQAQMYQAMVIQQEQQHQFEFKQVEARQVLEIEAILNASPIPNNIDEAVGRYRQMYDYMVILANQFQQQQQQQNEQAQREYDSVMYTNQRNMMNLNPHQQMEYQREQNAVMVNHQAKLKRLQAEQYLLYTQRRGYIADHLEKLKSKVAQLQAEMENKQTEVVQPQAQDDNSTTLQSPLVQLDYPLKTLLQ